MTKILSIAIPTWNRAKELDALLDNITAQIRKMPKLGQLLEIVVGDNGSTDETRHIVEKFRENKEIEIRYFRHAENKGAIFNVKFVMNAAEAQHLMVMGDDDRFAEGSLDKITSLLQLWPQQPVILFQSKATRVSYSFEPEERVTSTITETARFHFNYLGNAGVFAVRCDLVQAILRRKELHNNWTCWPQTEIMFRCATISGMQTPFLLTGVGSTSASNHAVNTRANAYYLWETGFLSLVRTARNLKSETGEEFYDAAIQSLIPAPVMIRHYFRMIMCLGSTDTKMEVKDLREAVKHSLHYSERRTALYTLFSIMIAWCPRSLARLFYFFVSSSRRLRSKEVAVPGPSARSISAVDYIDTP